MIQLPVDPLFAEITWSNHFLYDFISLLHLSGGIASSLQHWCSLLMFVGICLRTALVTAFQSGWALDFDLLLQPLDSFLSSRSIVDLVCLGSLSCCMTQYWLSFSCWTDVLTLTLEYFGIQRSSCRLDDCEVPGSCGYKPNIISPPQHLWLLLWGADVLFRFSPNVALCITATHLHFVLLCSKDIVLEVLSFVQMHLVFRC